MRFGRGTTMTFVVMMALAIGCTSASKSTPVTYESLPVCVAANGEKPQEIKGAECFTPAAKPSGACTSSDPTCQMGIFYACDGEDPTFTASRTFFECTCASGRWDCTVVSQDESACLEDAG